MKDEELFAWLMLAATLLSITGGFYVGAVIDFT